MSRKTHVERERERERESERARDREGNRGDSGSRVGPAGGSAACYA